MVVGRRVAVGTTPVSIRTQLGLGHGTFRLIVKGSGSVFLGDSSVSATSGFPIPSNIADAVELVISRDDDLYAVSGSSGFEIYVLANEV